MLMLQVIFKAKKDSKGSDLKCNANILPILIGYFMNFRIRIHQNGYLKRKRRQSTKKHGEENRRLCSDSGRFVWRRNVHTALQLFAIRLAVFLKVFSR